MMQEADTSRYVFPGLKGAAMNSRKGMDIKGVAVRSIFAGLCIGLGGVIFLSCENRALGAFLFSAGLFSVLVFGFDLFTGKVCFAQQFRRPLDLVCIWIGNYIGAAGMALAASGKTALYEKAAALAEAKLAKSTGDILADGIICGICIAVAVRGYRKAEGTGKYLAVILGVMVFILAGAEHVVANMFYMTMARAFGPGPLVFLLINTAGNIIGGGLFALLDLLLPEKQ